MEATVLLYYNLISYCLFCSINSFYILSLWVKFWYVTVQNSTEAGPHSAAGRAFLHRREDWDESGEVYRDLALIINARPLANLSLARVAKGLITFRQA